MLNSDRKWDLPGLPGAQTLALARLCQLFTLASNAVGVFVGGRRVCSLASWKINLNTEILIAFALLCLFFLCLQLQPFHCNFTTLMTDLAMKECLTVSPNFVRWNRTDFSQLKRLPQSIAKVSVLLYLFLSWCLIDSLLCYLEKERVREVSS